jgi:hypothetical protein
MLAMQMSIAACRCANDEFGRISAAAVEDGRCDAHDLHQSKHYSCNRYAKTLFLNKKVWSGADHPEFGSFIPRTLVRVLKPLTTAESASAKSYVHFHIQAAAPPVCIRHCTLQL